MRWLRLDVAADALASLRRTLSIDEAQRAGSFGTEALRRRAVVRYARRRELLAAALGVPPDALALTTTPTGQPFVAAPARLSVSASSCGDLGVLAWSSGGALGVDLESAADLPPARRALERIASPEELAALGALGDEELPTRLLGLWTRKEAYLKATGEGVGAALRRTTVPLGDLDGPVAFVAAPGGPTHWIAELEAPARGLRCALVVADGGDGPPEVAVSWA